MHQPIGRVVKLEYRDLQPKMKRDTSALIVHIRGPDGDMYEHPLENGAYLIDNHALQYMALNDIKPSDINGTSMNVEDWKWYTPVAPTGDGFGLAQTALKGGQAALRDAEWFGADDSSERADDGDSGPNGGGGGDGGDKGGAKIEHTDDDISAELTEDSGVEVTVE